MRILERKTAMRSNVISDDAFAHMVSQEVKNKASEEERQFLADPQNVHRWLKALSVLLDHLDDQIEEAIEDMESDVERYRQLGEDGVTMVAESRHYYEEKIAKIKKFRFYVSRKTSEVERIVERYGSGFVDEEKKLIMCRDAILAHRMYLLSNDIETTPADEALYEALEGVWSFDKIKDEEAVREEIKKD